MTDIRQYEPLWGSWYIDAPIGEGSFGKVYRVKRQEFGRTHYSAVKIIAIPQSEADLRQARADGLDSASMRSYFRSFVEDIVQEIDLMSEFKGNSNIVSFEDYKIIEKQGGFGYDILIRMELLTSLPDYTADKPLAESEIIKLGVHICRALELCAQKNVIHRDIKPDNIFVSQYGEYKLGDFGIARQIERTTGGLSKKGTYTYMAPEVFKGGEYGASVDVYSLGIVMYRCLNRGRTPFMPDYPAPITPRNREEALSRRTNGERIPPIAGAGPALNDAVLKACAYDRASRYKNAAEMRAALEALAGGGTVDRERTDNSTVGVFGGSAPDDERPEYVIIKGKRYKTDATELFLPVSQLKDGDIVQLKYFTGLTKLRLGGNQISDLAPLAGLTDLTELDLWGNQISDLAPLVGLTNLTLLGLDGSLFNRFTQLQIDELISALPDCKINWNG